MNTFSFFFIILDTDYPGVGPEHAHLSVSGRAKYVGVDDKQALEGFQLLAKHEGIIPALEVKEKMRD